MDTPEHFLELSVSERVRVLRTMLEDAMRPYDGFDVIAHMWFANTCANVNTYVESEHEGLLAAVEFCAALVAGRSTRAGNEPRNPVIPGDRLGELMDLLRQSAIGFAIDRAKRRDDSVLEKYRAGFVFQQQLARNVLYISQEIATFRALFGESVTSDRLLKHAGFNADDAEQLYRYFADAPHKRILSRRAESIRRECEYLGRADLVADHERALFIQDMLQQADVHVVASSLARLTAVTFADFGDVLTFTSAQIATDLGLSRDRVEAFCALFSLEMPAPVFDVGAIRDRPLLNSGGKLCCVSAVTLMLAMRRRCEEALKDRDRTSYEKKRGAYVEAKAAELFVRCLSPEACVRNGRYCWQGTEYEFDLLLIKDHVAVIVESKGGTITAPARRGAQERFERDIGRLLLEATEQAFRFRDALLEGVVVCDESGCAVPAVKSIKIVYPVVVTLEQTAYAGANLWNLSNAGLLPKGKSVPWAVCLHDLEKIAELIELPATLVGYLGRRRELASSKQIYMHDELDAFLHYLQFGLVFPEFAAGDESPDYVLMGSLTDELDAYYAAKAGLRTEPAPKPRQKLPSGFLDVLMRLESKRPTGYLAISLTLLAIGYSAQEEMDQSWRSCLERSASDGRLHDMSFTKNGTGITYMTGPPGSFEELRDRLQIHCKLKHYQHKTRSWAGIGRVATTLSAFQCTAFESGPWSRRKDMERLLDVYGLAKSEPTRPGSKFAKKAGRKGRGS